MLYCVCDELVLGNFFMLEFDIWLDMDIVFFVDG